MKKFSQLEKTNESLKEKIASGLIGLSMMVSSCDSITPEEKQRLQTEIQTLAKQEQEDRKKVDYYDAQVEAKRKQVQVLDDEAKHLSTKIGILKKGKTPKYILKLEFREHKMDLSLDKIHFEFEIPVDEQFYKESEIGKELAEGSRAFSMFHSGDITIVGKRIE